MLPVEPVRQAAPDLSTHLDAKPDSRPNSQSNRWRQRQGQWQRRRLDANAHRNADEHSRSDQQARTHLQAGVIVGRLGWQPLGRQQRQCRGRSLPDAG